MAVVERMSRCRARTMQLQATSIVVAFAFSAGLAASALAGTYQVYSCRTPSGAPAPTDGWSPSKTGTATVTKDTCSQAGGGLVAGLRAFTAHAANTDEAVWAFAPPEGETIASAILWRAGDTVGGWVPYATYQFWVASSIGSGYFDQCLSAAGCAGKGTLAQPLSIENRLVVPASNLGSHLYAGAACGGLDGNECPETGGDPNGYAAAIYLYAADLTLEQTAPPTASDVGGELANASVLSGTSDVVFSASDPGSGVYEALVSVDGQVVQRTVLDEDGGRCRSVGDASGGPPAFLYLQPCPAVVNADVGFDTARVANGTHHLVVSVTDAAGNTATVLDRNITVDNLAPAGVGRPSTLGGPNGTNASSQAILTATWSGAKGATVTSGYGHTQTVIGRLTDASGAPIAGAQLDVLATPRYLGATTASADAVRTDADGRFTLELPAGASSRTLLVEYSYQLGGAPVATKTLTLTVRAGVALSITPRTTSVGHSIYFSGRLPGAPIPGGGKLLVLEARSPGGAWLEFDVVRTDARGRYHASYRFKFPGPAVYQFRVLCQAEADYPFATGSSRTVGVYER
jgi:hypothetical protein